MAKIRLYTTAIVVLSSTDAVLQQYGAGNYALDASGQAITVSGNGVKARFPNLSEITAITDAAGSPVTLPINQAAYVTLITGYFRSLATAGGGSSNVTVDNFPTNYPDGYDPSEPAIVSNATNGGGALKWLAGIWDRVSGISTSITTYLPNLGSVGTAEPTTIPDNATNGFGIRKLLWRIYVWLWGINDYVALMQADLNSVRTNTNAGTGFTGSGDSLSQFRALADGFISTATVSHTSTSNSIFSDIDARGFNSVTFLCTALSAPSTGLLIEHSADGSSWQTGGIFFSSINGSGNLKNNGNVNMSANLGALLIVPVLLRYVRLRIQSAGSGTSTWAAKFQQENLLVYEADYNRADNVTVNSTPVQPSATLALIPATGTKIISAATTNATLCASGNKGIVLLTLTNTGASAAYFKVYNKATAPTVGTDTPVWIYCIPAGQSISPPLPAFGLRSGTLGLGYAITGGAADADTTAVAANQVIGSIFYV